MLRLKRDFLKNKTVIHMSVQPHSREFRNDYTNYTSTKLPRRLVSSSAEKHNVLHKGYEDLFEISIFASTVLSVLNSDHGSYPSRAALRKSVMFSPAQTRYIQLIAEHKSNALKDEVSTEVFQNVLKQLACARKALSMYSSINHETGTLDNNERKALKALWRNLTTQLLICFYELQSIDPSIELTHLGKSQSSLEALLQSVRAGNSPCAPTGEPVYPSWIKRRGAPRQACSIDAKVLYRGRTLSAVIRDVSTSGCRLSIISNFNVGDKICLSIPRGIDINCLVVRATDKFLGLVFEDKLPSTQKAAA